MARRPPTCSPAGHESEMFLNLDRQGPRHYIAAAIARPRRRDDRVEVLFAAAHESAIGTRRTYRNVRCLSAFWGEADKQRSEEHTSELQSLRHLVCRLLLEKKKTNTKE